MDIVFNKFKELIEAQGLFIERIDEEGFIYVKKDDFELRITLDNVSKRYEQEKDLGCVAELVEVVMTGFESLPGWAISRKRIFFSLMSNEFDFGNVINYPITSKVNTVFVYSFAPGNVLISEEQLTEWGISQKELVEDATVNMNRLLDNSRIESELIEERPLLFFETQDEPFKASLLVSKNLRAKVENLIGWPVYAVFPVRDFCYLFSENDLEFFAERLGSAVVREFTESAYPLSTELIKISDDGIEAIGEYPVE